MKRSRSLPTSYSGACCLSRPDRGGIASGTVPVADNPTLILEKQRKKFERPVVTLWPPASLKEHRVRRKPLTALILIVIFATSMSACVAGWGSEAAASCCQSTARAACSGKCPDARKVTGCTHKSARNSACKHVVKPQPGKCGMRSFAQRQFLTRPASEISIPLRREAGNIAAPDDGVIIVSSIGSPETDRGPPNS